MATLYLIRHGQASFGAADYDNLSDLGRRQAEAVGQYFRDTGIQFDAVYSGDLKRQHDTAKLAMARQKNPQEHIIDRRFNEINIEEQIEHLLPIVMQENEALRTLVETQGLRESKNYQKAVRGVFNHWVSLKRPHPNIQNWPDYSNNVRSALSDVMLEQGRGKTVGIFTSGGTIATIVAQTLGLTGSQTYQFYEPVFNGSVTQIFYNGTEVSLSSFNDCSFLRVREENSGENLISYR